MKKLLSLFLVLFFIFFPMIAVIPEDNIPIKQLEENENNRGLSSRSKDLRGKIIMLQDKRKKILPIIWKKNEKRKK